MIQAEGIAKRYRLGQMGGATLSEDIGAWLARLRGKPDPRAPIGSEHDSQRAGSDFWALRDVGFELRKGEILGIIGRNGAGKSTLLKLLSRITLPTSGVIRMRGRVSSLLEVGTGFNPELSGRENIYLNGSILGMKKAEIDRKLNEIIVFSGIEHHIDSPVKRYSSGMKVRLGFAVAAHLEPEILIIDEVLAVGDAEFQRKCMGKMKDVSQSGRTILFVSHNMTAVQSLCTRVIWLDGGRVRMDGETDQVVQAYLGEYANDVMHAAWPAGHAPGANGLQLQRVDVLADPTGANIDRATELRIGISFITQVPKEKDLNIGIHVFNDQDVLAFASTWRENEVNVKELTPGEHVVTCTVPAHLLNEGGYRITVNVFEQARLSFRAEDVVSFTVRDKERQGAWFGRRKGVVRPLLKWEVQ